MKPKTNKQRKTRDIDKDTVVAYHDFIQGRIQGELNGVTIGPGYFLSRVALGLFIFGFACLLVGILVVTLRHKHVYLVDWNAQFLGPFFIILFLLCCSFGVFLLMLAKRRTNQYRKDLAFRPIGDYGVAVVHKSKLTYDDQKKSELKSGTTPHNVRHPQRPGVNDRGDRGHRGDYSRNKSYDSRGYKDEHDRPLKRDYTPDERDYDRNRRDDREKRDRDYRDGRREEPRRERDPNREGGRRGNDPDRRRPPNDEERKRRPPPEDFQRGPREGGDRDRPRRPRPPPGSEEEKRREEGRRRYEAEKRRRYEEDRKRAELRKQAEAESDGRGNERGVDVDATRTYQIQTTVKLSREMQDMNESDL